MLLSTRQTHQGTSVPGVHIPMRANSLRPVACSTLSALAFTYMHRHAKVKDLHSAQWCSSTYLELQHRPPHACNGALHAGQLAAEVNIVAVVLVDHLHKLHPPSIGLGQSHGQLGRMCGSHHCDMRAYTVAHACMSCTGMVRRAHRHRKQPACCLR